MKAKTVFEWPNGVFSIRVTQTGKDRFVVQYGLQIKAGLSYVRAAHELGECLFHAQACEGIIDYCISERK